MAERSWTKPLARAALMIALIMSGASRSGFAQAPAGSLTGKLTNLYSKPLEGASLTLRNQATGAELRTTTTKGGNYSFKGIEPGDYSLDALSLRLGHGSVNGIEVIAGHEERMQIAVQLTPASREEVATAAPPIAAKSTSPMGDKVVTASSPSMARARH